tara:strand:- start:71 stop:1474 length:1404 start_codon:yes stop_codon:yes gene_type:complete
MKKLLLILLCLPLIGFGQNVNIPDANFKAYLVGEPSINTNGDSEIQVSEATAFNGTVNCYQMNISDLTGIEAFTALTYLHCIDNQLTSLDISQNTALIGLSCGENQLTSLDVSNNTSLVEFDCRDNLLTSLDVRNGNNINMGFMDICFNNGIGTFDNPYLSCINVDDSTFSANFWTSNGWYEIDPHHFFSNNCNLTKTYVPDNNFEQKLINLGYDGFLDDSVMTAQIKIIINLDISNSNISDLTGIEDFTNLEYLDCGFNQLTSLDVSQRPALEHLECDYNQLTSLDVSQSPALTSLNCSTNVITSLNLSQCPALEYLECGVNQLTSLDLSQSSSLSSLSCVGNQLTNLDVSQNTSLTQLYCAMNQLTSLDVRNGNNTNLTDFWSGNNPNLSCINVDDIAWATTNWTSIDPQHYFSNNCSGTAIQEHSINKEILKVTDLLGRETKQTNQPLLYLYDDGTVEKRIIIE